jgi:hypothetical protein
MAARPHGTKRSLKASEEGELTNFASVEGEEGEESEYEVLDT